MPGIGVEGRSGARRSNSVARRSGQGVVEESDVGRDLDDCEGPDMEDDEAERSGEADDETTVGSIPGDREGPDLEDDDAERSACPDGRAIGDGRAMVRDFKGEKGRSCSDGNVKGAW